MLVVGFRMKKTNTLFSKVVNLFAGPPTHCLLGNPDTGEWWHADSPRGVEYVPYNPRTEPNFEFYEIPNWRVDHAIAFRWARRQGPAKYDWFSVVFYWTPLTWRTRWTCSEYVAASLVAGGEHGSLEWDAGTPRKLLKALKQRGYQRVEV